jgi:hypothetical protein
MRYDTNVKLFAVESRRAGMGWKEVQARVEERFGVKAPTIRAMQKWEALGSKRMMRVAARERAPQAAEEALRRVTAELVPVLLNARDAGGDVEIEGWMWFFSLVERQLGLPKFRHFISEYLLRRGVVEQPQPEQAKEE